MLLRNLLYNRQSMSRYNGCNKNRSMNNYTHIGNIRHRIPQPLILTAHWKEVQPPKWVMQLLLLF